MDKEVILVVSFGTTEEKALEKTIGALEQAAAEASGGREVRRAFTSETVIRKLRQRGIPVDSPEEALYKLQKEGIRQITVLPTFLAPGGEFRRLRQTLESWDFFEKVVLLPPLMDGHKRISRLAQILRERYAEEKGQAVLFMGHGSDGEGNACYRELEAAFERPGMYVAVLKGNPDFDSVLERILQDGYRAVHLVPLMLSAGTHAAAHMAGDSTHSWAERCRGAGLTVRWDMTGLGELETVRRIYTDRLRQGETG